MPQREERVYSTAEVARWIGVHPSRVIQMDNEGIVSPTKRKKGAPREFSELDVTAHVLRQEGIEKKLNPYPRSLDELVAMVQRGKREEMRRAEIRVYQRNPGFGVFVWVPNVKDRTYMAEIERWSKEQGAKLLHTQNLADTVALHLEAIRAGIRDRIANRAPFDEQEN